MLLPRPRPPRPLHHHPHPHHRPALLRLQGCCGLGRGAHPDKAEIFGVAGPGAEGDVAGEDAAVVGEAGGEVSFGALAV